jgi:hypothetical protein
MVDDPDRGDAASSGDGSEQLAVYASELAAGVERSIEPWVVACVDRLLVAYRGHADESTMRDAHQSGLDAREVIAPRVRALLETDIDQQRSTPLAILREAVVYPTGVLERAGVPPVERDADAARQFPDDLYDLTPMRFGDIDPSLDELGLRWGAAKAYVFKARRREEGRS